MVVATYSLIDIIWMLIFGILFVFVFYIQRLKSPSYYFEIGDIIYGFKTNIKLLAFVVRIIIIVGYGFILSIFFKDYRIPLSATTFGAFLVVWPGFLRPDVIFFQVYKKRILLYTSYVIFILIASCGSFLGWLLYRSVEAILGKYWSVFWNVNHLLILLFDTIFLLIFSSIFRRIIKTLNKEIKFGRHEQCYKM